MRPPGVWDAPPFLARATVLTDADRWWAHRIDALRAEDSIDGRVMPWQTFSPPLGPQCCRIGFRPGPVLPAHCYQHPRDDAGRYRKES